MFVGPAMSSIAGRECSCNTVSVQDLVLKIFLQYQGKGFEIKGVLPHSLKLLLELEKESSQAVEQLPI